MVTFGIRNLTSITLVNRYDAYQNAFSRVYVKRIDDENVAECLRILNQFNSFRVGTTSYDNVDIAVVITLDDEHIYISTKDGLVATMKCEGVSSEALKKLTFKVPPNVTFNLEMSVTQSEAETSPEVEVDINSIRQTIESSQAGVFDFLYDESGMSLRNFIGSHRVSTDAMYMSEVILERQVVSSQVANALVQPNASVKFYYEAEGLFIFYSSVSVQNDDYNEKFIRTDDDMDRVVAVFDKHDLTAIKLSSFRMDLQSVAIGGLIMILNSRLNYSFTPYGMSENALIDESYREIITDSLNYNLQYVLVQIPNFALFAISNLEYARRINMAEGLPVRLRESSQATIDALNDMRTKCSIPVQEDRFIVRIRKVPNVISLCFRALILILLIKNQIKNENFN